MKALERDLKCLHLVRERGTDGMASLEHVSAVRAVTRKNIDETREFTAVIQHEMHSLLSVNRDFSRAAKVATMEQVTP